MEQNFDFQFTSEEDIQHLLDGFVEGMQDMVAERAVPVRFYAMCAPEKTRRWPH